MKKKENIENDNHFRAYILLPISIIFNIFLILAICFVVYTKNQKIEKNQRKYKSDSQIQELVINDYKKKLEEKRIRNGFF